MENKINIVELLKDCPSGMELNCTIWDNDVKVYFKEVLSTGFAYPIVVTVKYNNIEDTKAFTKYGAFNDLPYCNCVIFPKGKTTWEGFVPPCKFKDGDIISDSLGTCIFKGEGRIKGTVDFYCGVHTEYFVVKDNKRNPNGHYGDIADYRLATEEEKERLFQAIKDNGYRWNPETKILEKLIEPKFKDGDIIYVKSIYDWICIYKESKDTENLHKYVAVENQPNVDEILNDILHDIDTLCYRRNISEIRLATEEEKERLFQAIKDNGYKWNSETKTLEKLIIPKFKVGDKIKDKNNKIWFVVQVSAKHFDISLIPNAEGYFVPIEDQDEYELVPNKFDITTLVPFESRVLVRNSDSGFWKPAFWGIYEAEKTNEHQYRNYLTTEGFVRHCIPYNDETKHLIGKTIDCPEYYKTW